MSAPRRRGARCGGFTLIEMLTTLSVLVVTLAIAAPSLSSFVRSSRIRSAQSELVSSLMLARNEAARRGVRVGVQAKGTAAAGGLARGWRVWVDDNGDGIDSAAEPARARRGRPRDERRHHPRHHAGSGLFAARLPGADDRREA